MMKLIIAGLIHLVASVPINDREIENVPNKSAISKVESTVETIVDSIVESLYSSISTIAATTPVSPTEVISGLSSNGGKMLPRTLVKKPNLAATPPMGWMSWHRFRCITDCKEFPDDCLSERQIKSIADAMARDGWKEAGYDTIMLDDCWSAPYRDPFTNKLIADPWRFKSGMPALVKYVHDLGLKFGIYTNNGEFSCSGFPGSKGFEELDAQTFVEWDVDIVKLDSCIKDIEVSRHGYEVFSKTLAQSDQNIVLTCSYPAYKQGAIQDTDYSWVSSLCHVWQNFVDLGDSFSTINQAVDWYGVNGPYLNKFSGPGGWNDADKLLPGNSGLTKWEAKSQISFWAILANPLTMSHDLRKSDEDTKEILTNRLAIEINQDELGAPGIRLEKYNGFDFWARPLSQDRIAICILSTRSDGMAFPYLVHFNMINKLISEGNYQNRLYNSFQFNVHEKYTVLDVWDDAPNDSGVPSSISSDQDMYVYIRPHSPILWILTPIRERRQLSLEQPITIENVNKLNENNLENSQNDDQKAQIEQL